MNTKVIETLKELEQGKISVDHVVAVIESEYSLPPAEGAEEILNDEFKKEFGHLSDDSKPASYIIRAMSRFASLQNRPQPTAEGAEEIHKIIEVHEEPYFRKMRVEGGWLYNFWGEGSYHKEWLFVPDSTLHAQRLAEKMVEDMRQKLFSMRSTKEAMDKLSEEDRLMQYGYHDCINEMLMWTKKLSHD